MTSSSKVYAGMATMPTRGHTFRIAVQSILPQVDRLFLDRFPNEVSTLHQKVTALPSQLHGDLRANGKLLGLMHVPEPGIYFTVDDDILYPPDYVRVMVSCLDRVKSNTVVGVHGTQLKRENFGSYRDDRTVFIRDRSLPSLVEVDVAATCTAAFRMSELCFDVRNWKLTNMVDLHFAIECQKRSLRRVLVPRPDKWVRTLAFNQPDSILANLRKDDRQQTELARNLIEMSSH